jgi:hypothetical protein
VQSIATTDKAKWEPSYVSAGEIAYRAYCKALLNDHPASQPPKFRTLSEQVKGWWEASAVAVRTLFGDLENGE